MSNNISWLEDRIKGIGPPIVIDGGMGTELEKIGVPMDGNVWSARAILSHPESVRATHESFISAGAEVIITNTFSTGRHMLEPGGLGDRVKDINLDAVKLAIQARDAVARGPVAIAGSICEWAVSDAPEWNNPEAVRNSVQEQADYLAEAGVDIIALEMCENTALSKAALDAVMETGLPLWIGVSAKTHKDAKSLSVASYEELDFELLVKSIAEHPAMIMNVMHTPLHDVSEALKVVRQHWNGPVGIYPESGYFTMPNWQFVDVIEPDELVKKALPWVESGVTLVGGCCGLGPEHIRALRHALAVC